MTTSISEARINANRQNAQKSTGPKTDAGKARSRGNATKHGLTAAVVAVEEVPEVQPAPLQGQVQGGLDRDWLSGQVTRTMAQIARAARIETKLREEAAFRATTIWDDERMAEAEDLGTRIGRDPARVVARLRLTSYGCEWLMTRWSWLARAAGSPAGWTEAQTSLAFHLLGIPPEGRGESVLATVATWWGEGQDQNQDRDQAELGLLGLAERMIADLATQMERVIEADEIARSLAEGDMVDLPTPTLARLRRYEQALHRQLTWLMAELRGIAPRRDATQTSPQLNTTNHFTAKTAPAPDPQSRAGETNPTPASASSRKAVRDPFPLPASDLDAAFALDRAASAPLIRSRA